jgi:phage shock protein A
MNFFRRLFKIGQAEANAAIDHIENPIKLTEQGIRDMKTDLEKSLEALAQVKAMAIRAKNEMEELTAKAEDYQQKAMLLLKKGQKEQLTMVEAERLAKEALVKREESGQQATRAKAEAEKFDASVQKLESNVQEIKKNISKWENELKTLKARVKVANATKKLNKQMAAIDSSSTVGMLERMKDKVNQEEALAEAYGNIADAGKSVDEEINKAIDVTSETAADSLEKLKEQLGINNKTT